MFTKSSSRARPAQVEATELMQIVAGLDQPPTHPDGLFVVGSGVDIAPIKRQLEELTSLTVSAPEEPETALARGAAVASANAPLFASSTAAMAYAQDAGPGAVGASGLPGYLSITDAELGEGGLAYSAVADDEASAATPGSGSRRTASGRASSAGGPADSAGARSAGPASHGGGGGAGSGSGSSGGSSSGRGAESGGGHR
jgi:hypothetical protein